MKSMKDHSTNKPAFPKPPVVIWNRDLQGHEIAIPATDGMSLRDYFIAHAPAEPPSWFRPKIEDARPILPDPYVELCEADRLELRRLDEFAEEEGNEKVKAFCKLRNKRIEDQKSWDNIFEMQRFFQWPVAWADQMMLQRLLD